MSRPTICRMCGEKFKPIGTEHVCGPCIEEIDALELATPPSPQHAEKEDETNEHTHNAS